MTLGLIIEKIILAVGETMILPQTDKRQWHQLFFSLNKIHPELGLLFDWDGPYPECRDLNYILDAFRWTGKARVVDDCFVLCDETKRIFSESLFCERNDILVICNAVSLAKRIFAVRNPAEINHREASLQNR